MGGDENIRQALIADLLETDVAYFEAGAVVEKLPGATIAHMPGFYALAAGCVVQRVDSTVLEREPEGFINRVETALGKIGAQHSRIYLQHYSAAVEDALVAHGYRATLELVLALPAAACGGEAGIVLREVKSARDWRDKKRVHEAMAVAPDGHVVPAGEWVTMERKKCASGYMQPYLVMRGDEVVGAVNAAPWKGVLRLKNVFVHPDSRLRGAGTGIARAFGPLAAAMDKLFAGAFVLANAAFIRMYINEGYEIVSQQTEWFREL